MGKFRGKFCKVFGFMFLFCVVFFSLLYFLIVVGFWVEVFRFFLMWVVFLGVFRFGVKIKVVCRWVEWSRFVFLLGNFCF